MTYKPLSHREIPTVGYEFDESHTSSFWDGFYSVTDRNHKTSIFPKTSRLLKTNLVSIFSASYIIRLKTSVDFQNSLKTSLQQSLFNQA